MFSEMGRASRSGAIRSVRVLERILAFSSGQVAILNQSGGERVGQCDERQSATATRAVHPPLPPRENQKNRANAFISDASSSFR